MTSPIYWYAGYLDGPDGKWTCAATMYAAGIFTAGMCAGRRSVFTAVLHWHVLEGPSRKLRILEGPSRKPITLESCR